MADTNQTTPQWPRSNGPGQAGTLFKASSSTGLAFIASASAFPSFTEKSSSVGNEAANGKTAAMGDPTPALGRAATHGAKRRASTGFAVFPGVTSGHSFLRILQRTVSVMVGVIH